MPRMQRRQDSSPPGTAALTNTSASSRRPKPGLFYGWIVVAAVGLTQIANQGAASSLFALLLLPLQATFGWNRATLTASYSLSSLVLAVVLIPVGGLVDRYGARIVLLTGGLIAGLSLVGLTWVDQPWQLDALIGVGLGLGLALTSVQVGATAIANWFVRRRGTALAWLSIFMGLAVPLYVPLASWLIVGFGWRVAVDVLAAIFVLVVIPGVVFIRRHPEDMGLHPDGAAGSVDRDAGSQSGSSFHLAMMHRGFWWLSISSIFPAVAYGIVNTHQIAFMVGSGFAPTLAASVVAIAGLASLPGRFLLNAAADWLGQRLVLIFVLALQVVGIAILMSASSLVGLLAYSVLYGASTGAAFGVRNTWLGGLYGRKAFGAVTAAHGTLIYFGGAIGPILAGALFDHFGSYQVAFTIALAITAASIGGLFFVPSPGSKPAPSLASEVRS